MDNYTHTVNHLTAKENLQIPTLLPVVCELSTLILNLVDVPITLAFQRFYEFLLKAMKSMGFLS